MIEPPATIKYALYIIKAQKEKSAFALLLIEVKRSRKTE